MVRKAPNNRRDVNQIVNCLVNIATDDGHTDSMCADANLFADELGEMTLLNVSEETANFPCPKLGKKIGRESAETRWAAKDKS